MRTIGFLGTTTPTVWASWTAAFVRRLGELGWIEGRSVAIEYRWAESRVERFTEIAAEFARLNVDVIVTAGLGVAAALTELACIWAQAALQSERIFGLPKAGAT